MTPAQNSFFKIAIPAAQACESATDIPASITIAQAALESGWLQHMPTGSNNPFGIKAEHKDDPNSYIEAMTTEYVNGVLVHIEQPFQKYPTLAAAFIDHGRLLSKASRYAPAMAEKKDPVEFATQLQKCGYSTSPTYAKSLIGLINKYDLRQYDQEIA